ncbi:MAG TPA: S8/S53 family peptidase [Rugosimonospora sp.]|nr:S8/S53 family peptidase [Rugosimonospora sp.]
MSGISRRRLLTTAALAAAGTPALALLGAPAWADYDSAYQAAFAATVTNDPNVRRYTTPRREFLYRPRQLLVGKSDVDRVLQRLRQLGYVVSRKDGFGGVVRLVFDREVDVPGIVAVLRDPKQWDTGGVPAVQPHHVTVGYGNIMGNPDGPPTVDAPLPDPDPARLGEGLGVVVGVCDTGIWHDAAQVHPLWLGGAYTAKSTDEDPLYLYSDVLALEGGHGTFVAGVLRQAAPGVSFAPHPALNPSGIGDEEMLVGTLSTAAAQGPIVNLSLGCYTQDDVPPLPIANTLAALPTGVVVVAAAGNAGTSRPAWPAAFPTVLGVAAVTTAGGATVPAPYSNFGGWVDACATGEWVSTYVKGEMLLTGEAPLVFGGFARWAGTSFATPWVAGRLARLMTAKGYSAPDAQAILLSPGPWRPDYGVLVS